MGGKGKPKITKKDDFDSGVKGVKDT